MRYYRIALLHPGGYWVWYHRGTATPDLDVIERQLQNPDIARVTADKVYIFEADSPEQLESALYQANMLRFSHPQPAPPSPVVPERLDIENRAGGDKGRYIPYCFEAPTSMPEISRWMRIRRKYLAGDYDWEHDEHDPRNALHGRHL
jgi:hypothetical protein